MVITGLTRNQLSGSYRTKGSNPLPSANRVPRCAEAYRGLFFYKTLFFAIKQNVLLSLYTQKPVIEPIAGFLLCIFLNTSGQSIFAPRWFFLTECRSIFLFVTENQNIYKTIKKRC